MVSTTLEIEYATQRKATGNHLIRIHFPRKKLRALSVVSATLEIEYATQFSKANPNNRSDI